MQVVYIYMYIYSQLADLTATSCLAWEPTNPLSFIHLKDCHLLDQWPSTALSSRRARRQSYSAFLAKILEERQNILPLLRVGSKRNWNSITSDMISQLISWYLLSWKKRGKKSTLNWKNLYQRQSTVSFQIRNPLKNAWRHGLCVVLKCITQGEEHALVLLAHAPCLQTFPFRGFWQLLDQGSYRIPMDHWMISPQHSCKWLVWVKIRIPGRPQNWSYLVLESPFWVQRIYWYNLTVTQLHPQKLPACANEKVDACEDDWSFPLAFSGGKLFNFSLSTLTVLS